VQGNVSYPQRGLLSSVQECGGIIIPGFQRTHVGIVIPGIVEEQSSSFLFCAAFFEFLYCRSRVFRGAVAAAGFGSSTSRTEERAREKFDKHMQE
jgi:hypothetical protein